MGIEAETTSTSRPASLQQPGSRTESRSSTRKEPIDNASALKTIPSPLLTSSLHSRNSATSAQESAYLTKAKLLWWTRLALVLLITATSTAAIGCAGHVLHDYNGTSFGRHRYLPLWPANIDIRPTLAVLIPAAIIVASSVMYLVFSLIPTPYSRTLMYNVVFTAVSAVGVILCLFAIPFNTLHTDPSTHHSRDSLQSWTCKFADGAAKFNSDALALQLPVFMSGGVPVPAGFKRLCMESKVGLGLMVAVFVLEIASCAVGGAGMMLEKQMHEARKARYANNEKDEDEIPGTSRPFLG
ncbi:hypothetical protein LTR10_017064 [Elasticomyces elasticus]|uniref:MARVEL domain-containing protein n=1 Tax=Exophiala sideris TaxID=1016849 RepID=A0ABR0IZK6_9EURO|nr:hypothetical protein LTR10_017064 [Elasticomyces elasticus]KAK5023072.1 hypothetical protein LTS07_009565 [Exophiala sideris]KAK5026797.1 hypothetical protein LTR13_009837 [Exophiala sideris]KAK5052450.1 hypothetical protein LTR69_009788 [Exophiala sideris]KAK5178235.1 hypothetical protein LTR44_009319 [Eurotiomycetes sp. CCFEE 6388]